MTFRVTEKMLQYQLEALNDGSKCRYQIGSSYGRMNLEKCSMQTTGISSVSMGNTKAELYYQLQTLLSVRSSEKRNKIDFVKNCLHMDTFNLHSFKDDEKREMSHIRESTDLDGKFVYTCITCKKQVSKKMAEFCQIPRTRKEFYALVEDFKN